MKLRAACLRVLAVIGAAHVSGFRSARWLSARCRTWACYAPAARHLGPACPLDESRYGSLRSTTVAT